MKRTEAKNILIPRLSFKDDGTTPESGLFFEVLNTLVNKEVIKDLRPDDQTDINDYLFEQKELTVLNVLADVFDNESINDSIINDCISLFDNLILYKMNIRIIEMYLSSQRSNRAQRITAESIKLLHFEVNGNSGKGAVNTLPFSVGMKTKYNESLQEVKSRFGTTKRLNTITQKWWSK